MTYLTYSRLPAQPNPRAVSDLSTILFARPSFVEGMGRVLDLGNTLHEYNRSPTGVHADFYALWADWRAVGEDLMMAIETEGGGVEEFQTPEAAAER